MIEKTTEEIVREILAKMTLGELLKVLEVDCFDCKNQYYKKPDWGWYCEKGHHWDGNTERDQCFSFNSEDVILTDRFLKHYKINREKEEKEEN